MEYQARNCDCCDSQELEQVWNYDRTCKTRNNSFQWTVNNVICQACGFAFVSPVPTDESLALYYGDSFSIYAGQEIDYSIDKRLNVIKFCQAKIQATRYLETGSNNSPEFIDKLSSVITHIETVELNEDCSSTYNTLADVPQNSQEIIASYFVLEHIPNPKSFLETCYSLLIDNGFLIIEVPNLNLYPKDPAGLMLYEHLNHFSPATLMALAKRCGLETTNISLLECSRGFGFVAVFQKTTKLSTPQETTNNFELLQARAYMREGRSIIEAFHDRIASAQLLLKDSDKNIVIWAANEICSLLLTDTPLSQTTTIVDADPRKSNYLSPIPVYLPQEAIEQIKRADIFIINTNRHATAINNWICENAGRESSRDKFVILDYLD